MLSDSAVMPSFVLLVVVAFVVWLQLLCLLSLHRDSCVLRLLRPPVTAAADSAIEARKLCNGFYGQWLYLVVVNNPQRRRAGGLRGCGCCGECCASLAWTGGRRCGSGCFGCRCMMCCMHYRIHNDTALPPMALRVAPTAVLGATGRGV